MSDETGKALERARVHLERATLEGLEAASALLEAARHASSTLDRSGKSLAGEALRELERVMARIREDSSIELPRALTDPLIVALESEIERWERRARNDPDARTVLRTFLGLREVLWSLGIRRESEPARPRPTTESASRKRPRPERSRIQRFDIED